MTMTMNYDYEPFSVVNGLQSTDNQGRHFERNVVEREILNQHAPATFNFITL